MSIRLALGLEYDGSRFFGFQRQRQRPTVQECLEEALARVADHPVTVHCAGRTDTGVHAECQVVHFDTPAARSERAWVLGCNTHLPDGATAVWIRQVPGDFHARFSATGRSYRYRIINRWVRPALAHGRAGWVRRPLDENRMGAGARHLLGEHDFSSFRALGCQAKHPRREVRAITVERHGQEIVVEVHANAFLYHMVRNIVGTLVAVGTGEREPDWVAEVLAARDRTAAGVTMPPGGLYLTGIDYPDEYRLPVAEPVAFPRGRNQS